MSSDIGRKLAGNSSLLAKSIVRKLTFQVVTWSSGALSTKCADLLAEIKRVKNLIKMFDNLYISLNKRYFTKKLRESTIRQQ